MHPTSVILRLVLVLLAFIAAASALPYGRGLSQLILNNQPRPQPSPATGNPQISRELTEPIILLAVRTTIAQRSEESTS